MGYRDNLKNRALPHARLADFYTVKVVYFCSGEWCVFIPALTKYPPHTESNYFYVNDDIEFYAKNPYLNSDSSN